MPQRLSRTLAGVGKCMKERSVIETVNGDRRKEALFARLARGRRGITPPWKSRLDADRQRIVNLGGSFVRHRIAPLKVGRSRHFLRELYRFSLLR